jgi:uncharacterized protein YbjT (DUF2867 family)
MTMEIAVVGGHGKTGKAVTAALRSHGVGARPLGRAELADPAAAMAGCDGLYLIAPNMYADEPAFVGGMLAAALDAGVRKVVYHSVATPYAPTMLHHMGKVISEDLVRQLSVPWTILQPGPYLQNFLPALQADTPSLSQPYDVDKPFNFVDLADVAEAAAQALLDDRHTGATYELGGPDRMSVREVAAVAQDVLGKPVTVARVDPAQWAAGAGAGLEARVREWLLAMFAYYDSYGLPVGSLTLSAVLVHASNGIRNVHQRELSSIQRV